MEEATPEQVKAADDFYDRYRILELEAVYNGINDQDEVREYVAAAIAAE